MPSMAAASRGFSRGSEFGMPRIVRLADAEGMSGSSMTGNRSPAYELKEAADTERKDRVKDAVADEDPEESQEVPGIAVSPVREFDAEDGGGPEETNFGGGEDALGADHREGQRGGDTGDEADQTELERGDHGSAAGDTCHECTARFRRSGDSVFC